jgi:exo-beta-1,3-glucanase (GH17 family)
MLIRGPLGRPDRNFTTQADSSRVDGANNDVLKAVDFAGTDGYPYWQGATMQQAAEVFWTSVSNVQNALNNIKVNRNRSHLNLINSSQPGTPVWVTETGWPVSGPNDGAAVASISNAQQYWSAVACDAFNKINTFWFSYSEQGASPDFSVYNSNDQPLFSLQC